MKIKKISKNMIMIFVYMLMLFFAFFSRDEIIAVSNEQRNIIFILLFVATSIIYIMKMVKYKINIKEYVKLNNGKWKVLLAFVILYIIMLVNSIIIINVNNYHEDKLIKTSFVTMGMSIIALMVAFNTTEIFKEKNLKYILYAGFINYCVVIIGFIMNNGIDGFFNFRYLNKNFIDTSLEVHELAFIFGIIFIFMITSMKKESKLHYVILALFLFLGYKRIIIGAIVAVMFFYIISMLWIKDKEKMIKIISICTFIIVIFYLIFSSVGIDVFKDVFNKLGINLMGRNKIYEAFEGKFELSFKYFGKGLRSTDIMIKETPSIYGYGALHNDILRIYIENGMYVFLMYFAVFIFVIPYLLKKKYNAQIALHYCYLILFTVIGYTTDNLFSYYRFAFVFFVLIFFSIATERKCNTNIMENCIKSTLIDWKNCIIQIIQNMKNKFIEIKEKHS